jgi:hypothetical protein
MVDSEDEVDVGSSWISMKSLREAVNIKNSYKMTPSPHSSSSASPSHNSSITMEWKPNTFINQSVSFSFVHENYKNEDDEIYRTMDTVKLIEDEEESSPVPKLKTKDLLK